MHQANSLSSNERAGLELALTRMTLNAFGSLATFPLFCLRKHDVAEVRSVITERYDIWYSFLVVIREILRFGPRTLASANSSVDKLFRAASDIRDAYVELADDQKFSPENAMASYERLVSAFDQILICVNQLKDILAPEVDLSPLTIRFTQRRTYDQRNLDWFGDELRAQSEVGCGTTATIPEAAE